MKAGRPDPLTDLYYTDGVYGLRCKVCMRRQADGHRAKCPIGDVVIALAALVALIDDLVWKLTKPR